MTTEIIETRVAKISMGEDGIFRTIFLPGAEVTLEDIKEINKYMSKFSVDKSIPTFNDIKGIKSVTREARLFISGAESSKVCSAAALFIGSPISRAIGNLFLALNSPPYPTRIFKSEDE
ncbi:MAG: hypothetical protein L0Y73_07585, partial [Candidatus Aminicenantes bacterium]|nr:hypothetical protein [Candidatus Aminicenantes bacterium]